MQYLEQFNEYKELLVAVALFIYGAYRIAAVRRVRAASNA